MCPSRVARTLMLTGVATMLTILCVAGCPGNSGAIETPIASPSVSVNIENQNEQYSLDQTENEPGSAPPDSQDVPPADTADVESTDEGAADEPPANDEPLPEEELPSDWLADSAPAAPLAMAQGSYSIRLEGPVSTRPGAALTLRARVLLAGVPVANQKVSFYHRAPNATKRENTKWRWFQSARTTNDGWTEIQTSGRQSLGDVKSPIQFGARFTPRGSTQPTYSNVLSVQVLR